VAEQLLERLQRAATHDEPRREVVAAVVEPESSSFAAATALRRVRVPVRHPPPLLSHSAPQGPFFYVSVDPLVLNRSSRGHALDDKKPCAYLVGTG